MKFSETLKNLRKERGETQQKAAKNIGVSQSVFCDWENGKVEPSLSAIKSIAEYYEISTDYLMGIVDEWGNPTTESAPSYLEKYKGLPSGKPMLQDTRIRTPKERDEKIQQLLNRASETDKEKILNALEIMTESTTARAEPATPTAPMGELPPEDKPGSVWIYSRSLKNDQQPVERMLTKAQQQKLLDEIVEDDEEE